MNLKMARIFALFTGLLALCSVGTAMLLGLRLRVDRGALSELQQRPECAVAPAAKKGR